jgi:hypothetical protein
MGSLERRLLKVAQPAADGVTSRVHGQGRLEVDIDLTVQAVENDQYTAPVLGVVNVLNFEGFVFLPVLPFDQAQPLDFGCREVEEGIEVTSPRGIVEVLDHGSRYLTQISQMNDRRDLLRTLFLPSVTCSSISWLSRTTPNDQRRCRRGRSGRGRWCRGSRCRGSHRRCG